MLLRRGLSNTIWIVLFLLLNSKTILSQPNGYYFYPKVSTKTTVQLVKKSTTLATNDNSYLKFNTTDDFNLIDRNIVSLAFGIIYPKVTYEFGCYSEKFWAASSISILNNSFTKGVYSTTGAGQTTAFHCITLPIRAVIKLLPDSLKRNWIGMAVLGVNVSTNYNRINVQNGYDELRSINYINEKGTLYRWEYGTVLKKGLTFMATVGIRNSISIKGRYLFDIEFLYQTTALSDLGFAVDRISGSDGTNIQFERRLLYSGFLVSMGRKINLKLKK